MRSLCFRCQRCGREVIALGHEALPIRRICLLCEWADERDAYRAGMEVVEAAKRGD